MAAYLIRLAGHTARLNELLGHWAKAHKLKKRDAAWIGCKAKEAGIPEATGKRRVCLTVIMAPRQRCPDPDSFWKSVLDALTTNGLLRDDNPKWCECGQVEYVRGERAAMNILVEDV